MNRKFYKENSIKSRILAIILSLIILCVGGLIYVGFRDKSLLMFDWFEYLGLTQHIESFRSSLDSYGMYDWVKYSLPDGLWLIAYMFIINAIWNGSNSTSYYIFISYLPIFALLSEFLQYFGFFPGVFDWADIACYSLAILLFIIIKTINNLNYEV